MHVHVVIGDRGQGASKRQVRRQLEMLDAGYAGGQSATNAVTRFDFYLASFERVRRDSWHKARIGGQADVDMRRALHHGGPQDLNLYVLEPRDPYAENVVLGWATPPSAGTQAHRSRRRRAARGEPARRLLQQLQPR